MEYFVKVPFGDPWHLTRRDNPLTATRVPRLRASAAPRDSGYASIKEFAKVSHLQQVRALPEVSRFFGIVIQMYFDDHPPPHFHAIYAGTEAQIRIEPFGLMGGSLPPRALALVAEWATVHRTELLDNWSRARAGAGLLRIPPLE